MRNIFFVLSFFVIVGFVGAYGLGFAVPIWFTVIVGLILVRGFMDAFQKQHAVKKNFPLLGHFRYILESIRPEIQQYFVESNVDGAPINRNNRSVVYQRSKKELRVQPFGTQENLYKEGNEWVNHSMFPVIVGDDYDRVTVGGKDCLQPYSSSIFNVSAMSYGSLSRNAIEALNLGAAKGNFYHNTGEGGISEFHRKGGDLVWQIGTGYFGCRTLDGVFSPEEFAKKSSDAAVKMIEIKLSQGAKPGKGGMLPGVKVTSEIAKVRGVEEGKDVLSPAFHKAFNDAKGLLEFVKQLRDLSGGKPVGFKLCIGNKNEFHEVINQMKQTGITPDFITVDGAEGGTGAAPIEFSNAVGMPLKDGLSFVARALRDAGLKDEIRIIASGKSLTGFDMIRNFALGADIVNSGRGMMLALGCIQALRCHSNHCPVGITTNRKELTIGLDPATKALRVYNYHQETLKVVHSLLGAMGKAQPHEVQLSDIHQRQGDGGYKTFAEIY